MKGELERLYAKTNPYMQTWKQLSADVKVHIRLIQGKAHAVIYVEGSDLFGWGLNNPNTLGIWPVPEHLIPYMTPHTIPPPGVPDVLILPVTTRLKQGCKAIAAGETYAFFILDNGDLYGMGENASYQLGLGYASAYVVNPTLIDTDFTAVTASFHRVASGSLYYYSAGLKNEDLYLWGTPPTNNEVSVVLPKPVFLATGFKAISAGSRHLLALTTQGDLYGFGFNTNGSLGSLPLYTDTLTWLGSGYASMTAGLHRSLAITTEGVLHVGGSNQWGQLGVPGVTETAAIFPTVAGDGFAKVTTSHGAGEFYSLAVKTNGDLYTAGGELGGTGSGLPTAHDFYAWTYVASQFTDVDIGENHALAIHANGDVYACGNNVNGALGLGDYVDRTVFTKIDLGLHDYTNGYPPNLIAPLKASKIACSASFSLALAKR